MKSTKRAEKIAEYIESVSACIIAAIHSAKPANDTITYWLLQEGLSRRYIIRCRDSRLLFRTGRDGNIDAFYTDNTDTIYVTPISRFSWYLENPREFMAAVSAIMTWIIHGFYMDTLHNEIDDDIAHAAILYSSWWNAKWAIPHPAGIWFDEHESGIDDSPEYIYCEIFHKFESIIRIYTMGLGMKVGTTFAEQTVSAIDNLIFNWEYGEAVYDNVHGWTDGDMDDISCYANWLYMYHPETRDVLSRISTCKDDCEYEELLISLAEILLVDARLSAQDILPAKGSIYDCGGPFRCERGEKTEIICIAEERKVENEW